MVNKSKTSKDCLLRQDHRNAEIILCCKNTYTIKSINDVFNVSGAC